MRLLRKGSTNIIAKFNRTVLVICSSSREGENLSYSQKNKVCEIKGDKFGTSLNTQGQYKSCKMQIW